MTKSDKVFNSRNIIIFAAIVIALIVLAVGFEPVTRNVVFRDFMCFGCHQESEYAANAAPLGDSGRPITIAHPVASVKTPESTPARCVECHLPPGFVGSIFAYTHVVSNTDLFGRWHSTDEKLERAWIPPTARRAFWVQDRLLETDSSTCRTCHIEAEIKPKRKRGQKAHKNALKNKETCIECHDNLVHREVPARAEFKTEAGLEAGKSGG
ncbi:MAG: NapC/NirT family cytochrome c [Alphaproteobacteria bacterium]|nr:NapC/NirT family cytochrome c [Alphaproteobacteria bacterium]